MNNIDAMPIIIALVVLWYSVRGLLKYKGLHREYSLLSVYLVAYIVAQILWIQGESDMVVTKCEMIVWNFLEAAMLLLLYMFSDLPRKVGFR